MKKWTAIIILASAQFVMILDSTVMNVSITQVVQDLHTTINSLQSAIAFYALTMAAFMLIGAKLGVKWGSLRAFMIGSIIYGIGSFITGLSTSMAMLFTGWSVIEGLGAVLVIPAIAALVAYNYQGKDRVAAYATIGAVSGVAAAAGPLIGGFMTTYLSWRYVFFAETIVMIIVILAARRLQTSKPQPATTIEPTGALLSSIGLVVIVFAMLQSKSWGWVQPVETPFIAGHPIAPFGISLVAYLLLLGFLLLRWFFHHELALETAGKEPLLRVSMLRLKSLRSGVSVLLSQYLVTAAVFFIIPVYLQTVLGYDALTTGLRILPLSIALILFSALGSRLLRRFTPKRVVRTGQTLLVLGTFFLLVAIDVNLRSLNFSLAMFVIGAGLGLLASQLSNINISSVPETEANEVGGLQGTSQNLGTSLGTALIGSVLIISLTGGVIDSVDASTLPDSIKNSINNNLKSAQIIPASQVTSLAVGQGASQQDAETLSQIYLDSQLSSLKESIFFLGVVAVASLVLSTNIPKKLPSSRQKSHLASDTPAS